MMLQKFVPPQLWHAHHAAYLVDFLDCTKVHWSSFFLASMTGHLPEFSPLTPAALNNSYDLKLDIFIIILYPYPYEISFVLQPHISIHDTRAYIAL